MCGISGWWSFNWPLDKEFNIVGPTSALYRLDLIHARRSLDCPIWDGKQVRELISQAYRDFQSEGVYQDCKYTQSHALIQVFDQACT